MFYLRAIEHGLPQIWRLRVLRQQKKNFLQFGNGGSKQLELTERSPAAPLRLEDLAGSLTLAAGALAASGLVALAELVIKRLYFPEVTWNVIHY